MKSSTNFILTSLSSLLICCLLFFSVMLYFFLPKSKDYKTVQKTESTIPYSDSGTIQNATVLIDIENCPAVFLVNLSVKSHNISVTDATSITNHYSNKNLKHIFFELSGFENMINYLGGIEIETPYGLPCPAKNKKIIAKDELVTAYGASVSEILTGETEPTTEKRAYYCYIIETMCIKFLSECTPESYKILKRNCETNINYTEFYDNYKSLKNIKR